MSYGRGHTGRDLNGAAVVVMAFVAMAAVVWLDLTDGRLGPAFTMIVVRNVWASRARALSLQRA